jgi:Na+-transporting NADH:ubiquinone oxidoreductase subunit F
MSQPIFPDYRLTGVNARRAVEMGLAEADWYQCPVPRETMRQLLERRNGPAVRDTILWFALIIGSWLRHLLLWPSWWAVPSLSRCTPCSTPRPPTRAGTNAGHGTPFRPTG